MSGWYFGSCKERGWQGTTIWAPSQMAARLLLGACARWCPGLGCGPKAEEHKCKLWKLNAKDEEWLERCSREIIQGSTSSFEWPGIALRAIEFTRESGAEAKKHAHIRQPAPPGRMHCPGNGSPEREMAQERLPFIPGDQGDLHETRRAFIKVAKQEGMEQGKNRDTVNQFYPAG